MTVTSSDTTTNGTPPAAPIDPITAEVVRSAMETVCFEMATYVSLTATTPILNQSNERNSTILDGAGRLAALSVGIPQSMLSSTLPDLNVFAPVFDDDGELLLIASIQCHHGADVVRATVQGDPMDRDPQAVLDDVWDGYVSIAGALRDYAVVITGSLEEMTIAVDEAATAAERTARRAGD